ncbi:MAG: dTDP-4-dehydrorhamnose reductase [Gammaproteobacteria bacterium]|nr:dTDP-4-dehydrorhamnose reductase [Gammaproteobacteria bacterium]
MKSYTRPIILVTGKNGQVGWELQRTLMPLGTIIALGRDELDLTKHDRIRDVIQRFKPEVIINAAAYTAVDKAETELDLAMKINGDAPGILASEAKKIGALLIHYSTDYVFDGCKDSAYVETDVPNPLNHYGQTKLAGEMAIQAIDCEYLVLRTTWVYAGRGQNFLMTVLRLAQEREELRMIADQLGSPTWARLIAETTAHVIRQALNEKLAGRFESGLYHLTSAGKTSWFGFAEKIVELAKAGSEGHHLLVQKIHPITTEEYPLPAIRPKNSLLSSASLIKRFDLTMPHWESVLTLCFQDVED